MARNKQKHKRKRVTFDTPGRECPHADKGCCPSCLTGRPKQTLFSGPRLVLGKKYISDNPIRGRSLDMIVVDDLVPLTHFGHIDAESARDRMSRDPAFAERVRLADVLLTTLRQQLT